MRAPRAKKPELVTEVLRTLQVLDLLADGIQQRAAYPDRVIFTPERIALLAIAERIAARTSEEE